MLLYIFVRINRLFFSYKYYALKATYCIFGAPNLRLRGKATYYRVWIYGKH